MSARFDAFVTIAPGLEGFLAEELSLLDLRPEKRAGGVHLRCTLEGLWAIHLYSRLAGRVSVEVGTARMTSLGHLAGSVRKLPWKRWVHPGQPVDVKVHGASSRPDIVAKKVENAVHDALRGPRKPGPRPPRQPARIDLVIDKRKAQVNVDASGELLHRRGWRKATGKAPIRENLGAAMLFASGWEPGMPLVDPMCGSGTLVIEGGGIALGHAPGAYRDFAFERWPIHDERAWGAMRHEARQPRVVDDAAPILGADRSKGAVKAAKSNANRAYVDGRVTLFQCVFSDFDPPPDPGMLVVNPPYGKRVRGRPISDLARVLGERWSGWRYGILLPDRGQLRVLPGEPEVAATFSNGGIQVSLATGIVP